MKIRTKTKMKFLENYGFKEQKMKLWRIWMKKHELRGTPIYISLNDLNTIKTERELVLVLDELNR
jgi:hypothetical protein